MNRTQKEVFNHFLSFSVVLFFCFSSSAQLLQRQKEFTRADELRGGLRPERTYYDVLKYDVYVDLDIPGKAISGKNRITFKVLNTLTRIQLDLFENMQIDSIVDQGKRLSYSRDNNAVFIDFDSELQKGAVQTLDFYFSGNPLIAKNPPWDGGVIFTKDEQGKDWVSVAVQGTGASLWYPNKDTQRDEPEEAEIHIRVPQGLSAIANGRLTGKKTLPGNQVEWSWKVNNPINNYNLIFNVGNYVHFSDRLGTLDLDYYVLPYHLEKAKEHFKEVKPMLRCYTEKFGDYPFPEDGYKLIETPYLGMEHQSAIGYGNGYQKGYLGRDRSQTGVGLKWDFIIIHESAHEWFGNSITAADIADMWIHEAFTTYAEAVYIECRWGLDQALTYLLGTRKTVVSNDAPIIGQYGVNDEGSGDMYSKGANMLHTLRSIIHNDEQWWELLKNFHQTFKHQIINTQEVIAFFSAQSKRPLAPVFNQYLRYTKLPELQFKTKDNRVFYRWQADESDFAMPVDIFLSDQRKRLRPTTSWQALKDPVQVADVKVDTDNFYIEVKIL